MLAALQTGVPLEIGESSIVRLTRSKLVRFQESAGVSSSGLLDPESLGSYGGGSNELPKRYVAALRTFAQTNSMSPVLDGLTSRIVSRRKASRILGRVFLYLIFLIAAALAGLLVFCFNVTPIIEEMRTDIFLHREPIDRGFDFVAWLPVAIVVLAVMLLLMLIWWAIGGAARTAMWFGGRQYVRCLSSATALRILQLLIDKGMGLNQAMEVSCDLAGVDSVGRSEIKSAVQQHNDDDPDPQRTAAMEGDLRSMANYMLVLAEHRLGKMQFTVPVMLVALFGGIISLAYCTAIFSPIVSLLWDLEFMGTNL